jgi:hypothetical protein
MFRPQDIKRTVSYFICAMYIHSIEIRCYATAVSVFVESENSFLIQQQFADLHVIISALHGPTIYSDQERIFYRVVDYILSYGFEIRREGYS